MRERGRTKKYLRTDSTKRGKERSRKYFGTQEPYDTKRKVSGMRMEKWQQLLLEQLETFQVEVSQPRRPRLETSPAVKASKLATRNMLK